MFVCAHVFVSAFVIHTYMYVCIVCVCMYIYVCVFEINSEINTNQRGIFCSCLSCN